MTFRRYRMVFADGRTATVLDSLDEDPVEVVRALHARFANRPGYVVECSEWVG